MAIQIMTFMCSIQCTSDSSILQ